MRYEKTSFLKRERTLRRDMRSLLVASQKKKTMTSSSIVKMMMTTTTSRRASLSSSFSSSSVSIDPSSISDSTLAAASATRAARRSEEGASSSSNDNVNNNSALDYLVYTFPSLVCASLGYWQLQRREEKIAKIEARETALGSEPLRSLAEVTEDTEEFRRVVVEGELDGNKTVRVGPKVRTSEISNNEKIAGFDVITAIREKKKSGGGTWLFGRFGGSVVDEKVDGTVTALVNRGFAERGFEDAKGGLCLKTIGVVRKGDGKGYFTPDNVPEKSVWHYVDVRGIGEYLGLVGSGNDNEESFSSEGRGEKKKAFVPYVQLVRPIGGASFSGRQRQPVPVAEEELMKFSVLPEQHMNYSMTWFSLSAVTLGMASLALKKKKVPKL